VSSDVNVCWDINVVSASMIFRLDFSTVPILVFKFFFKIFYHIQLYKVYLALGRNQICKQKGQVLDTDHIGIYLVNSTTLQLETTTLSIYYMYIQFTFGYQKNISEILFKVALNTKTVTQKNILLLSIHWTTCLIYSGTCLI
jgi:hypothetical protein